MRINEDESITERCNKAHFPFMYERKFEQLNMNMRQGAAGAEGPEASIVESHLSPEIQNVVDYFKDHRRQAADGIKQYEENWARMGRKPEHEQEFVLGEQVKVIACETAIAGLKSGDYRKAAELLEKSYHHNVEPAPFEAEYGKQTREALLRKIIEMYGAIVPESELRATLEAAAKELHDEKDDTKTYLIKERIKFLEQVLKNKFGAADAVAEIAAATTTATKETVAEAPPEEMSPPDTRESIATAQTNLAAAPRQPAQARSPSRDKAPESKTAIRPRTFDELSVPIRRLAAELKQRGNEIGLFYAANRRLAELGEMANSSETMIQSTLMALGTLQRALEETGISGRGSRFQDSVEGLSILRQRFRAIAETAEEISQRIRSSSDFSDEERAQIRRRLVAIVDTANQRRNNVIRKIEALEGYRGS
jgi:hypothetical protein